MFLLNPICKLRIENLFLQKVFQSQKLSFCEHSSGAAVPQRSCNGDLTRGKWHLFFFYNNIILSFSSTMLNNVVLRVCNNV